MTQQLIDASAAKLAGLQIDLLKRLRSQNTGSMSLGDLEAFIRSTPEQRHQLRHHSGQGGALPPDHHRMVFSYYAPMPPMAQLKAEFGRNSVSSIFDGRPWKLHASCTHMDQLPGARIVWAPSVPDELVGCDMTAAIAWGAEQRTEFAPYAYRPMMHLEGYQAWKHFFRQNDPYLSEHLVMPGSFALDGVLEFVAVLLADGGRRILSDDWFVDGWSVGHRFLFVRNEQPLEA